MPDRTRVPSNPEDWMPAAREACDPDSHDHPGEPYDYPCWDCRVTAFFKSEGVA